MKLLDKFTLEADRLIIRKSRFQRIPQASIDEIESYRESIASDSLAVRLLDELLAYAHAINTGKDPEPFATKAMATVDAINFREVILDGIRPFSKT